MARPACPALHVATRFLFLKLRSAVKARTAWGHLSGGASPQTPRSLPCPVTAQMLPRRQRGGPVAWGRSRAAGGVVEACPGRFAECGSPFPRPAEPGREAAPRGSALSAHPRDSGRARPAGLSWVGRHPPPPHPGRARGCPTPAQGRGRSPWERAPARAQRRRQRRPPGFGAAGSHSPGSAPAPPPASAEASLTPHKTSAAREGAPARAPRRPQRAAGGGARTQPASWAGSSRRGAECPFAWCCVHMLYFPLVEDIQTSVISIKTQVLTSFEKTKLRAGPPWLSG